MVLYFRSQSLNLSHFLGQLVTIADQKAIAIPLLGENTSQAISGD